MARPKKPKPTLSTATEADIRDAFREHQNKLHVLTCKLCEETFKQRRHWQLFCSNSCRVMYFRIKSSLENAEWQEAEPTSPSAPSPPDKDPSSDR